MGYEPSPVVGLHGMQDPTADWEPIRVATRWQQEQDQPCLGSGWIGKGPSLKVKQGYRARDLEDGAGLCSLGRWPPSRRRLPEVGTLAKDLGGAMELNWDS